MQTVSHEAMVAHVLKLQAEGKKQCEIIAITGYKRHRVQAIFNGRLEEPKPPKRKERDEQQTNDQRNAKQRDTDRRRRIIDRMVWNGKRLDEIVSVTGFTLAYIKNYIAGANADSLKVARSPVLCPKCNRKSYYIPCQSCPAENKLRRTLQGGERLHADDWKEDGSLRLAPETIAAMESRGITCTIPRKDTDDGRTAKRPARVGSTAGRIY